jgi:Tfp pilus assembly protein PilF
MGIIFFSQGDLSAAEVNFRAALRINPAYRNAAANLNRVRALLKQREKTSGAK